MLIGASRVSIRGEYDYCDFEVDTTQAGHAEELRWIQQRRVVESFGLSFPGYRQRRLGTAFKGRYILAISYR